MTVRLSTTPTSTRRSRAIATALEPVRTDGYDATRRPDGGLQRRTASTSSSPARPGRRRHGDDRDRDGARRPAGPRQPQERPGQGDARGPGHGRSQQGASRVGMTAAQVAGQVRAALVAQTGDHGPVGRRPDGRRSSSSSTRRRSTSVDDLKVLPVGTVATVPLGPVADGRAGRRPGQHHPHRPARPPRRSRPRSPATTRAPSRKSVQTELDALAAGRRVPGRHDRRAGRRHPAAERGVRWPVRLDGRRHPARLRDDGPDLQLADHAVHHPVHACRSRRSAPSRRCYLTGRPIGVSALIGFLMLIGIVVTNAIVLLDLVERLRARGLLDPRRPDRGWPDPCPADPDDRDRDDPGADPAGRGLQPGLDHRGRARARSSSAACSARRS